MKYPILILTACLITLNAFSDFSQASEHDDSQFFARLFSRAYLKNEQLIFRPHYDIDWADFAPVKIKNIDIDNPTQEQLDLLIPIRDIYNNSEIKFEAELPPEIKKTLNCYLVSPNGISRIKVLRLSGTARFSMGDGDRDGPEDKIWKKIYYGYIVSEPVTPLSSNDGGFSLCAKVSLEFEQSDKDFVKDDIKKYFLSDESLRSEATVDDSVYWEVIAKYSFRIVGQKDWYRFFQLAPDHLCNYGCCGKRYFVTEQDSHMLLGWNIYECDV